jgi:hypothetical protein
MKNKIYEVVNYLVGVVALYIIGYSYMFYSRVGNFVAGFLPKKKIEEKVRKKSK